MPGGGNYGPESLANMFRTIFVLSVLAAGLSPSGALGVADRGTAHRRSRAPPTRPASSSPRTATSRSITTSRGNRVIVDAYTGKVIAIQPPQTRLDRRALRREQRLRELGRAPGG